MAAPERWPGPAENRPGPAERGSRRTCARPFIGDSCARRALRYVAQALQCGGAVKPTPTPMWGSSDAALLGGLAAMLGSLLHADLGVAAVVALVGILLVRRARWLHPRNGSGRVVAVACALCFFVTAVRSSRRLTTFAADHAKVELDGVWPARCDVEGAVSRSPTVHGDDVVLTVEVETSACPNLPRGRRVVLHAPREEASSLARDDRVHAFAQLAPLHRFWNPGLGDPRPGEARRNVLLSGSALDLSLRAQGRSLAHAIDVLRVHVRRRIEGTFSRGTEPMARALMLGENDLPEDDAEAFRESGLSHLLAVSGMHLVLVIATVVAGLRALLVRIPALAVRVDVRRLAAALGAPAAWAYADFAGGSGSAIRAAWMTSAALSAVALGRTPDTWRALGISVLGMMVLDPLAPFDVSFVLSAAATLGLLSASGPIERVLGARAPSFARFLVKPTAATAAATLFCAPVLLGMSPDLPMAGVVANLVAVPLGEVMALPLCLVHALCFWHPRAERGAALAASGALAAVRAVARWFEGLWWSKLWLPPPTPLQLGLLALAATAFALTAIRRRTIALVTLVLLILAEVWTRRTAQPRGVLRVTFLDVGQGDAAIVDLPDGRVMVVDAGGFVGSPVDTGLRVLAPELRSRRRSHVDVAVLSHPHPDHFGGLRRGLADVRLDAFWDTGQGEVQGAGPAYAGLLDAMRARGVNVRRPDALCGSHRFGGVELDVLSPCPDFDVDRGANDNSLVLRIRFGARSFLLVGDAEHEAEAELLRRAPGMLRADVLKVGHHGSRTSSSVDFLRAVDPRIAVVSSGVRNRFGHPHPRTLAALATATSGRIEVHRTDREGAVTITTDGRSLDVQSRSTMPM